jgi:hypothetical protein
MFTKILSLIILFSVSSFLQDNRTEFFPKKEVKVRKIPSPKKVWVFIMAGQSNMAGRGRVEPQDTIPYQRIMTVNANGDLILAKEPTGLDCGHSFGRTLIEHVPGNVYVLILPAGVGGSSISQWIDDSTHRNIKLLTNFREKIRTGQKYGTIKAILWHQGESDADPKDIPLYKQRMGKLFSMFREIAGNENLPVLIGELGTFGSQGRERINEEIRKYVQQDPNTALIQTSDLKHRGDKSHFDSEGQRSLGQRYALEYLKLVHNQ